jgi:hypothetical protein
MRLFFSTCSSAICLRQAEATIRLAEQLSAPLAAAAAQRALEVLTKLAKMGDGAQDPIDAGRCVGLISKSRNTRCARYYLEPCPASAGLFFDRNSSRAGSTAKEPRPDRLTRGWD